LELKFGEGGEDSRIFVHELCSAYLKYAATHSLKSEVLFADEGHIVLKLVGNRVWHYFKNETGQHCCQRVPPTEHKGRRHTSLIAVGVLPIKNEVGEPLKITEIDFSAEKSSGPGGQSVNKKSSACRATHRPTGITVFIQNERSQQQNREIALKILTAKVNDKKRAESDAAYAEFRKTQLGDGRRGSKVRTYNFIDSRVTDHRFGIKTSKIHNVMKGAFELLMP
jgi:peptide chain release factor 1